MANERRVADGPSPDVLHLVAAINGKLDTIDARLDTIDIVARMDESADDRGLSMDEVVRAFLDHGLQYVPNDCLMGVTPGLSLVSRAFLEHTRSEFRKRCEKRHPALALSSRHVTWPQWRRFELGTEASMEAGERWYIQARDLYDDVDVLTEISRGGSVVWHGVSKLYYDGRNGQGPHCTFWVPTRDFDVSLPEAVDVFSRDEADSPYLYWPGTRDCSLQQKALCKTLYCIRTPSSTLPPPSPLHVHVVFRRRSTGQMVTVLSTNEPKQIVREDTEGQPAGSYIAYYSEAIPDGDGGDDYVLPWMCFDLYCPVTVDENATSIRFSSHPDSVTTHAELNFYLRVSGEGEEDDPVFSTEDYVRAMQSWRWG